MDGTVSSQASQPKKMIWNSVTWFGVTINTGRIHSIFGMESRVYTDYELEVGQRNRGLLRQYLLSISDMSYYWNLTCLTICCKENTLFSVSLNKQNYHESHHSWLHIWDINPVVFGHHTHKPQKISILDNALSFHLGFLCGVCVSTKQTLS